LAIPLDALDHSSLWPFYHNALQAICKLLLRDTIYLQDFIAASLSGLHGDRATAYAKELCDEFTASGIRGVIDRRASRSDGKDA
jgi:hypothetical protein